MTTPADAPAVEPGSQRVPTALAVAILVGAVVAALVIVGAVVWVTEPRLFTGPAVAPPDPVTTSSLVQYDSRTRVASVRELQLTLPEAPYACDSAVGAAPPVFSSVRTCNALVHENYNRGGDDWYASFGLAVVSPVLVIPGNLQATGDQVYEQLRNRFFPGQQTTVHKRASGPAQLAAAGKDLLVSGEVHYSVAGLSSSYDRLLLVLVELSDGEFVACYSVRPNDTPQRTVDVLNRSLNTLRAR